MKPVTKNKCTFFAVFFFFFVTFIFTILRVSKACRRIAGSLKSFHCSLFNNAITGKQLGLLHHMGLDNLDFVACENKGAEQTV